MIETRRTYGVLTIPQALHHVMKTGFTFPCHIVSIKSPITKALMKRA